MGLSLSKKFKAFCAQYGIRNYYSTPAYPQSNGQAEASNKTILKSLKKKLECKKGNWPDELPAVLWGIQDHSTVIYGRDVVLPCLWYRRVIPLEVGLPTNRTALVESRGNDEARTEQLDLAKEKRECALITLAAYQEQLRRSYNKKVHPREFKIGNLVLRKVLANTKVSSDGKLGPNWEGPYKIIGIGGIGAYRLADLDGDPVPRPWNMQNLRKFYQ